MNLMAYGTLRDKDVISLVAGEQVLSRTRFDHTIAGFKVVFVEGQLYPLMLSDSESSMIVTCFHDLTLEEASKIEYFEGDEYEIRSMIIKGKAYQYFSPNNLIKPTKRLWTLEQFQRFHKQEYLKKIPEWMSV